MYEKSFELLTKRRDAEMWRMGLYVMNAVTVAIDTCINGRKAKSKYIEEPLREQLAEEEKVDVSTMTDEEIAEVHRKELEKMDLMAKMSFGIIDDEKQGG